MTIIGKRRIKPLHRLEPDVHAPIPPHFKIRRLLHCAIVGQTGSSFDVEIDDGEKVSKLKKAIKEENEDDPVLKIVAAKNLQLFLAKVPREKQGEVEGTEEVKDEVQDDMTWLYSRSEDVKKLKKGEKTSH
ncbi:hypothetical protein DVH05_016316 [Phytophthora capsici]|nr:hypothetical protein DVH05_016316 [Phytophthora capsici]